MPRIKALPKPVRTIIEFHIRSYWDKTAGNTYFSAQVIVNKDHDNIIYIPMQIGYDNHPYIVCLEAVSKTYKRLKDINLYGFDFGKAGIYISKNIRDVNYKGCKEFGER